MSITFADLFSGIGGFHAVGNSFGWHGTYACDIDKNASQIYQKNWGLNSYGDLTVDASETQMRVPKHDVLFAGFPCQPFSKGGHQRGMDEARGTLFWNIAHVLEVRQPKLVVLENVRNLVGPRHLHEWEVIIQTLRELGYRVSEQPMFTSPHRIPPSHGGAPQTRERIYINATLVPKKLRNKFDLEAAPISIKEIESSWNPNDWNLEKHIKVSRRLSGQENESLSLSEDEVSWIDTWDDFVKRYLKANSNSLPGFPLWADVWTGSLAIEKGMPIWKVDFINKNWEFYLSNKRLIQEWLKSNPDFVNFPSSRRKLEWQAKSETSLWDCALQLRPSGIRAKQLTYAPAIVAMTQTTIFGPLKRRLSVKEVSRLQGLPDSFTFQGQADKHSYRQLGNGISIGSAYQSVKLHVARDLEILRTTSPELAESVMRSPSKPSF